MFLLKRCEQKMVSFSSLPGVWPWKELNAAQQMMRDFWHQLGLKTGGTYYRPVQGHF